MKPRRPYRLTVAGGKCVSTFASDDKARDRGMALINSGRVRQVWIRHRTSGKWEELTRSARAAHATPPAE